MFIFRFFLFFRVFFSPPKQKAVGNMPTRTRLAGKKIVLYHRPLWIAPSDQSALFSGLATGLFSMSRSRPRNKKNNKLTVWSELAVINSYRCGYA